MKIANNYAQKAEPNPEEIANAIIELKNAVQNLNLQINENFTLTIEEMLKQLEQEVNDTTSSPKTEKPTPTTPRGKPPVKIFKPIQ